VTLFDKLHFCSDICCENWLCCDASFRLHTNRWRLTGTRRGSLIPDRGNLCSNNVVSDRVLHQFGIALGIQFFHDLEFMKGDRVRA
jgi:hypothetical protein